MPFGPNLSSPSNPSKRGARVGFALDRGPEVLANFFKLKAYYRESWTLT